MKKITLLKGDYIIISSVIGLALTIFALTLETFGIIGGGEGDIVEIYLNNQVLHSLPINKEETILIKDIYENTVVIENNSVKVTHSTCPDGICENFGSITKSNQTIICMPNRLIIKIVGDSQDSIDLIL